MTEDSILVCIGVTLAELSVHAPYSPESARILRTCPAEIVDELIDLERRRPDIGRAFIDAANAERARVYGYQSELDIEPGKN